MARRFGAPSAKQIIEQIDSNDASLTTVDLSGNSIFKMKSDEKCADLAAALKKNTNLKVLKLKDCDIGNDGVAILGEAFAVNNSLEEVDLSKNIFQVQGADNPEVGMLQDLFQGTSLDLKSIFRSPNLCTAETSKKPRTHGLRE